ncbi:hypothetical protein AUJ46_04750 [Candidatus Peregrinibacteria bacterium CG1_02_54_53]|nr:MAG: hypothetical protein AUJ46_04750 [Candidatus Peregrinibacteria bacterium CG1_02_54_53]
MRLRSLLLATALLALPAIASAEQQTVLNLADQTEQAQWNTIGLASVAPLSNGIHIVTGNTGTLSRPLTLPYGIDVVTLHYTSPRGASLAFIWHSQGDPSEKYLQIPITLQPSRTSTSIVVDLSAVGGWDPHAAAIGFQLQPGTDIILHDLELQGWSVRESLVEAVKCFWTFDGLKAHSINFFWGPLLCSTPVSRENLYRHQPPIAHSAMRVVYALLLVSTAIIAFRAWRKHDGNVRKRILAGSAALILVFWIVLDIRMGAELIATWSYDVRSYLQQPMGKRTFRTIGFLPDFALATQGILMDQPRYVFITPTTDTFMNFMRYQTYPSLPVTPEEELALSAAKGSGATIWLVYGRPDLTTGSDGRIVENGIPISPSGSLVHQFAEGIFVFRAGSQSSSSSSPTQ